MDVHTRAVIPNDRLGHKRCCFAVGMGHVVNAVLQNLYFVSLLHQGIEANADLALSRRAHLVVMYLNV